MINKKSLTCAISGKKAKYLDPMTKMTYATKEAFKILREKFYQSEEEKTGQRIQALNELLSLKKDKHKRHKTQKIEPTPMSAATPNVSNKLSIPSKQPASIAMPMPMTIPTPMSMPIPTFIPEPNPASTLIQPPSDVVPIINHEEHVEDHQPPAQPMTLPATLNFANPQN